MLRTLPLAAVLALALGGTAMATPPQRSLDLGDWPAIESVARGQTVYWHAWGGDERINAFIAWVGEELNSRHGVQLEHVRLAATTDAVARVVAERAAGRDTGGAVDVIWINGANFISMKEAGLLHGPFAEGLPNWPLVDTQANPAVLVDFTVPVEGHGAPWAMFQMVFEHDSAVTPQPPLSLSALRAWIAQNPGRFTYPQPPDFLGTSFLKQALYGVLPDPTILQGPADAVDYAAATQPLWDFLDEIHPNLWRAGRAFPANEPALSALLADGEVDIAFTFNPGRTSAAIADGELPATARTFVLQEGTIGNSSFLSIPYNAANLEGALVLANLILDPAVQARAQDPAILGFQTVLGLHLLAPEDRARFAALELGIATLAPNEMGQALLEPHPDWMTLIAEDWQRRYGVAR